MVDLVEINIYNLLITIELQKKWQKYTKRESNFAYSVWV